VTVYPAARATWYGPGFYGRKTACGTRLRKDTLGVAHRKLPCGTPVTVFYKGRTVTVPVIDRGPFAHGARWDLTAATAQAIGFQATDTVGALKAQPG
jgi:rare lipoprotein A